MKILWFSPVQLTENEDIKGAGGWVIGLAKHISKNANIDLNIAFKANCKSVTKKTFGEIITYHIPSEQYAGSKIKKIIRRLKNFLNIDMDRNIVDKYRQIIKIVNPDIIQLFGSEHEYGLILPETDIPVIIHIQCIYQVYHHKWYSGISEKDVKKHSPLKSKILRRTLKHLYNQRYKTVEREKLFYKQCNYFMGRTDWDRRCIKVLAPHSKYYHCDEVMRGDFFKFKWNKEPDCKSINIMSTLGGAIYKGLETIVETVEILEKKSKYNIKWRIAGLSNSTETVKICRNKYKSRFSRNIILLGKINSLVMIENMLESDMYIHPSHIEDGSNAISEAMLLGLPVITTAAGGLTTTIRDGETGLYVQDGDPWSMAGTVIELYEDKNSAKKMGENAKKVAFKRHNPDKIVNNLVKIYKEIIVNSDKNK